MRSYVVQLQKSRVFAYVAAVILVFLTAAARFSLGDALGERAVFLSFLPAVAISAYLGGLWPGLFATIISAVIADLLFLHWITEDPRFTAPEMVQLCLYALAGVFVSGLTQALRDAVNRLETAVRARHRDEARLRAEHVVTRLLADSATLEEAAPAILQSVRDSLHASVGALWLPEADGNVLRCRFTSAVADPRAQTFAQRCADFRFARGVGLPGRVWESTAPAWIVDVVHDSNFPRAPLASEAGICSGMAFPICGGGQFFGVVEFFIDHPLEPDPALLNMIGAIGSEIGQFILRRRAEEALRDSDQSLRLALEAGRMGTWEWEIDSGKVTWSPGLELIHGLEIGTFAGTFEGFVRDIHPDDRQRVIEQIRQTVEQRSDHHIEYRLKRPDGSVRWVEGRGKLFCDALGNPLRMVGVCTDITERKQAEAERDDLLARERQTRAEAERASKAKDEFLAVLSHELRTPLTPVLLTVTLMENSAELSPEHHRDLQTIRRNVELEARLIDDLLDLTRIARGKLQLEIQTTDVHLLIRSAIDICHRSSDIHMEVDLGATNCFVRADPARLQQVFWNLLNNAHKFTPAGGSITVRSRNSRDGMIRVDVIDTGVGIDPRQLPKIFDAFEQGHVQSRRFGGLGLGLAISKALISAQGGTLIAHSEGRGRGSTFTVELPFVRQATARRIDDVGTEDGQDRGVARPLRILVVEDHDATRRVMTKILTEMGHRPMPAAGMESAMRLVKENPVDLVISDLGLPDGDGHDLMRQLRAQFHIRGIALSGYGMDEDLRRSAEAGFAEHLTKPIDMTRLEAAIRRVVEQPAIA